MPDCPLVSIVITSFTTRRMHDIYELLDSVLEQDYPSIEIIFVAEKTYALVDNLKKYAREKGVENLNILFNEGKPGLSAARNMGINEARGAIIAFVDDDAVLTPGWVSETVKVYQDDPEIIGVTGPALPLWEKPDMSWFPEELYWIISCTAWADLNEMKEVRNAWGHGMSFRAEAFEMAGLFSTDIGFQAGRYNNGILTLDIGDDVEMSLRIKEKTGKKIVVCPKIRLFHRVYSHRTGCRFIAKRSYWVGRSRRILKQYQSGRAEKKDLLSQENVLLKRILTRLFPQIAKKCLSHPITACRMLFTTVNSLSFVVLGYYSHILPRTKRTKNLTK